MAVYNTSSDAANTAVRALLTKIGEYYLNKTFSTRSGYGRRAWTQIKEVYFHNKCAYCEIENTPLQIEHLIMFNRTEYGLHHPGNIVPVCSDCNKRRKDENNKHVNWLKQLEIICIEKEELNLYNKRKNKILFHINKSEFQYPNLSDTEKHAIRVIVNSLYENIKTESDKSLSMYKELKQAFVKPNSTT